MARDHLGKVITLAQWIRKLGCDDDFKPEPAERSTAATCGSRRKLDVMRERVAMGQDLYHPMDETQMTPPATKRGNPTHTPLPGIRVLGLILNRRKKLGD